MAKSVKRITREFNEGMTRREASRKAQNERRKAQRRLARILSEETGEKINWKDATNVYKSLKDTSEQSRELYATIESLTARKKEGTNKVEGYGVDLKKTEESLSTFTRIRFGKETLSKKGDQLDLYNKNKLFTHQINQATRKDGLSTLNSNETHGFYAVTQYIWKGTNVSDNRNAVIMNEFGLNDLKQVYDLITNKDLKPGDFGFKDKELFEQWLEEIKSRVDLDKIRDIYKSEMLGESDEPDSKYDKLKIANIKIRASKLKRYAR